MRKWRKEVIVLAMPEGPRDQQGVTYNGLGLHEEWPEQWSLTHLATGMQVCTLHGSLHQIRPTATKIAELGDWSFSNPAKPSLAFRKAVQETV